jgi:NADPH:quinone reductase-like Zn-dependent oxidoreductase
LTAAFRDAAGGDVDIIVDYIAGALAESALSAASAGCRYVQVGSPAGDHITVSALTMRHLGLEMLGYAGYRTPLAVRRAAFARLNQLACDRQIDVDVSRVALDDLPSAWESTRRGSPSRQVVVP